MYNKQFFLAWWPVVSVSQHIMPSSTNTESIRTYITVFYHKKSHVVNSVSINIQLSETFVVSMTVLEYLMLISIDYFHFFVYF